MFPDFLIVILQSTRGGWVRMCAEPADLGVIGGWEGGQKYRAVSCGADFTAAVVDEESIPGGESKPPDHSTVKS